MKRYKRHFFVALFLSGMLLTILAKARAGDIESCMVCGMDVSKYTHSRYMVETTDGEKYVTCGVQCGLTLHLRLKDKWKAATATDLISNRQFNAKNGFYVYKSSVITDMAPGFISFKRKVNAEKFAKGFGGQVLTYEEALKIWGRLMD